MQANGLAPPMAGTESATETMYRSATIHVMADAIVKRGKPHLEQDQAYLTFQPARLEFSGNGGGEGG